VTTHIDQNEALAAAERLAVATLHELSAGCEPVKILTGSTKRGPAFLYYCAEHADLSMISVPAGGLRNRDPGDPTSRSRISTFALASIAVETGAYIESDGTIRARFVLHVPNSDDPEWEINTDGAAAVGAAVAMLRCPAS
jgi:hypothetical protein